MDWTPVDGMELQVREAAGETHYSKRLMDALGDGREWRFTGSVLDTGTHGGDVCMCGSPIRYVFQIQNTRTGEYGKLGSSCIIVFKAGNPEAYQSLKAAEKKLRQELNQLKKEAKAAALAAQVQTLAAALEPKVKALETRVADWKTKLADLHGADVASGAFYTISTEYHTAVNLVPPRYLKPSEYEQWFAGKPALLDQFETVLATAMAKDYTPIYRYAIEIAGEKVGANTVDDLWWKVSHKVATVTTYLNAKTNRKFEWSWKASTRFKILAEYGVIVILRSQESPEWWQPIQPIPGKVAELSIELS